jgi:hypothetical protein
VKRRGVRLELEELSSVTQHAAKGALAHCAVIVKGEDDRSEQHHLIAFVVVHTSFPGNVHDLCDTLFDTIPLLAYAKPVMITPIENIPLTAAGKVDRRALASLRIYQSHRCSSSSGGDCSSRDQRHFEGIVGGNLSSNATSDRREDELFRTRRQIATDAKASGWYSKSHKA